MDSIKHRFVEKLPQVIAWIDELLLLATPKAKPVSSYKLPRLPLYFGTTLLAETKVVIVDCMPIPPLTSLGLTELADFENMQFDGITYKDIYFVKPGRALDEGLHFHELVHVLQWRILGPEAFLLSHGQSLVELGYFKAPFELMAYHYESLFRSGVAPYDVEPEVRRTLRL